MKEHSPLNIFTNSLPAIGSSIGYKNFWSTLRLSPLLLNINVYMAWCLNQSLFRSFCIALLRNLLSHILIRQREGKPDSELVSCCKRKELSRKNIPHPVKTELPFLYGAIHSTHATPALSSAKYLKIPFKHMLQFCSVIKAAPVLSSFLESRSRH